MERSLEGKTQYQIHSLPALGYFLERASGRNTPSTPLDLSLS